MAAIRGNSSFQGTIQDSADLEIVESPDFRLNWYTDYPSRIPVKEGSFTSSDYANKLNVEGWRNNLLIMSGLPYILDVFIPNLPVGTAVTLVAQDMEFEGVVQPTIVNTDSNTVKANGVCRFKVTFSNPPVKNTKYQSDINKPTPIRWNYYVTFKLVTTFGDKLFRVMVHNSGLGNQPIVGTYDKDNLLFLPINKTITLAMVSAGGGGGAIGPVSFASDTSRPASQRYSLYGGQDDADIRVTNVAELTRPTTNGSPGESALLRLVGSHRWLNWNIPVSGALQRVDNNAVVRDSSGNLLTDDTILVFCTGGTGGGQSNQGGGLGGLVLQVRADANPTQNRIATGRDALAPFAVTLQMETSLSLDGDLGSNVSVIEYGGSNGGAGYIGPATTIAGRNPNPYNPNVNITGQGGMGARRFDVFDRTYNNPQGSSSNGTTSQQTGGGGGSGALVKIYLRYASSVSEDAGRKYMPPLILSLTQASKILGGQGGRGTQYGYDGADGTVEVLAYGDVPFND